MSRLEFWSRPLVQFDPANKEHRRIYAEFVRHNTWGRSPYRFILPECYGSDLVEMIQRALVEYYINQEFNSPRSKPFDKRT